MQNNPALTGIRAVAIIPVVAHHCTLSAFKGGFFGVDIFFVLSGFLITSLLREGFRHSGHIDYRRFLWRRFVRLTPPLYVVVLTLLLLGLSDPSDAMISLAYLGELFHFLVPTTDVTAHTWSLAVEAHFYLLWPVVLVPIMRSQNPAYWIVALFIGATAWRLVTLQLIPAEAAYYRFDARLSGLLLGAAVAAGAFAVPADRADRVAALSACIFIVGIMGVVAYSDAALWGMTAIEFAAAGLVMAALHPSSTAFKVLAHPVLQTVGLWSYSLYLWHYPVAVVIAQRNTLAWLPGMQSVLPIFLLTLAVSLALAAATYYAVERPISRLRSRLTTAPQSPP